MQSRFLSEVREALHLALASAEDPRLFEASLVDVHAEPGNGPLVVLVAAPVDHVESVREALAAAKGRLRTEVAESLQRKRAAELTFVVVALGDDAAGDPE